MLAGVLNPAFWENAPILKNNHLSATHTLLRQRNKFGSTHRHRDQTCGCQGREGGRGRHWEFGVRRCKLLHREWINNKVLMQSTGKYIQYPVINHNGKEYKKYVYMCMTESLCCTAEIGTML